MAKKNEEKLTPLEKVQRLAEVLADNDACEESRIMVRLYDSLPQLWKEWNEASWAAWFIAFALGAKAATRVIKKAVDNWLRSSLEEDRKACIGLPLRRIIEKSGQWKQIAINEMRVLSQVAAFLDVSIARAWGHHIVDGIVHEAVQGPYGTQENTANVNLLMVYIREQLPREKFLALCERLILEM